MSVILPNTLYIGERVEWDASEAENRSAGVGTIDSIYPSMADRVCYRIQRDEIDRQRQRAYEFIHEADLRREVAR